MIYQYQAKTFAELSAEIDAVVNDITRFIFTNKYEINIPTDSSLRQMYMDYLKRTPAWKAKNFGDYVALVKPKLYVERVNGKFYLRMRKVLNVQITTNRNFLKQTHYFDIISSLNAAYARGAIRFITTR